ncbi:putative aldo/keto reductase [Escherichia coli]|uniref:Putative aldo/keto reductase n=1 Tax=Escherichia coli TaxID=562 RepID=A0A377CI80_ECOLX|nr:putative aldo/keto reductase [Escherichia coli]
MQQKMIQFSGDVSLPAVGQGTWYMGEDASQRKTESCCTTRGH